MTSAEEAEELEQFTAEGSPEAESFLRDLLDEVKNRILEESSPRAVLLQGSFARGEGTVRFDDEGQPQLWRDLDLVLVYRTREQPSRLRALAKELNALPGIPEADTSVEGGEISLVQLPRYVMTRWRDLKTYEMARRSRLLAGEDVREEMAVRDGRIPIESGLRFLYQKAKGLSIVADRLEGDPFLPNYEISKLYRELATVLALAEEGPKDAHEERIEALHASPDQVVRGMADRADRWARYKIQADWQGLREHDPRKAWMQGRRDLNAGLRRCHEVVHGDRPELGSLEGAKTHYQAFVDRFFDRTVATLVTRSWPPRLLQRIAGATARRCYAAYAWTRGSAERRILSGDPLLAFYVAQVLLVNERAPDQASASVQTSEVTRCPQTRAFMKEVGVSTDPFRENRLAQGMDDLYGKLTGPLYGVG